MTENEASAVIFIWVFLFSGLFMLGTPIGPYLLSVGLLTLLILVVSRMSGNPE